MPIGVVPSPSWRLIRSPFQPTRAGYGPPAATQQAPERRQILAVAYVVLVVVAWTVISWRAVAGGGVRRVFAGVDGHPAASATATCTASSIGGQGTLPAMLAAPVPPYVAAVQPVAPADIRSTWRAGCPVGPAQLRTIRISYWGFDAERHIGRLVVRRTVTGDVAAAFRSLYRARFPIRRMVPVSAYRGSDDASMAADNTSAFNCRRAVGSSTGSWSEHAYGEAVDVNPVENPYVLGGRVLPPAGRAFLTRSRARRGMAVEGGALVHAFDAVGWGWGGRWSSSRDYQHFSRSGR